MACRPCIGGGQGDPVTLRTQPLPQPVKGRADAVRKLSTRAYGRSREEIEEEIWERQHKAKTRHPGITQFFCQHAIPCLHEEAIERFANLVDSAGGS